jgi:hypothetical protein
MTACEESWEDYRKLRKQFSRVLRGYVLIASPIALLWCVHSHTFLPGLIAAGFCVWLLMASTFRLAFFLCPRCGQSFFSKRKNTNPFTRNCMHCGLEKWKCGPPLSDTEKILLVE